MAIPVSVTIFAPDTPAMIGAIQFAESVGVPSIWLPTMPTGHDPMVVIGAALAQTQSITLGAGIITTYPRHPMMLASQAQVIEELASGRLRMGLGVSHPFIISGMYGIEFGKPISHLREYVTVLRGMLNEGCIHFEGKYYQAHGELAPMLTPPKTPLPIAALRPPMFRFAGEMGDGALTAWCPAPYLVEHALPAMQEGADAAGRERPPLMANVPIVFTTDQEAMRKVARESLDMYVTQAPAYVKMFEMAGYPIGEDRYAPDALVDELFAWGDPDTIKQRLRDVHAMGIDEVMVTVHPVNDPMMEIGAVMQLVGEVANE